MRCVRISFNKLGESKYISHLDLMRCMSRAVRRAKIPLWYTEGFNPHPYMTFALPLSLGMESRCESMDIRIEGDITDEQLLNSLRAVMPESIEITGVYEPVLDPKLIAFAEFDICFSGIIASTADFASQLDELLKSDSLIVEKLAKKGHRKELKQLNLAEYINDYSINCSSNSVILSLTLPAGSTVNINPALLSNLIIDRLGDSSIYAGILRKRLLTAQHKEFV